MTIRPGILELAEMVEPSSIEFWDRYPILETKSIVDKGSNGVEVVLIISIFEYFPRCENCELRQFVCLGAIALCWTQSDGSKCQFSTRNPTLIFQQSQNPNSGPHGSKIIARLRAYKIIYEQNYFKIKHTIRVNKVHIRSRVIKRKVYGPGSK